MLKSVIFLTLFLALGLADTCVLEPLEWRVQNSNEGTCIAGVFRTDGVIVPFARYANGKWTNPWSKASVAQPDGPETIADLLKPWYVPFVKPSSDWYLSLPAGTLTVRTSNNFQVCSHCQQVWGLMSDYPNAEPAKENQCVRTLGLALDKRRAAHAVERLDVTSPEAVKLLEFLRPQFERAENEGPTEANKLWYSQIPVAEERAKVPVSVLKLYRHQMTAPGQILFYFEMSKEYRRPADAHDRFCINVALFDGWVLEDRQRKLALLQSRFSPTDCDWKEGGLTLPFAVLRLDGRTFVITEEDSYEGESYVILEILKGRIVRVLETYAGSC